MSAKFNSDSFVDHQFESKFVVAPAEIRREIYVHLIPNQIHLFRYEKGLRLSACVQRYQDDRPNYFEQQSNNARLSIDPDAPDPVYARRLGSSWGSHWRCEESAMRLRHNDCETDSNIYAIALLLVCKRMLVSNNLV